MASTIRQVDETRLESDLRYRFEFLTEYIGFTWEDVEALEATSAQLLPQLPDMVDAIYDKLAGCNATSRHFLPPAETQTDESAQSASSSPSFPSVCSKSEFRAGPLAKYLTELITGSFAGPRDEDGQFPIRLLLGRCARPVPFVQMNALMAVVSQVVLEATSRLESDEQTKHRSMLAANKVIWLQNDLIVRQHAR